MVFSTDIHGRKEALIELFTNTFAASEGVEEGALIGGLVRKLLNDTAHQDLFVFVAETNDRGGRIVGGIIFSRLTYSQDDRTVFVLAPVAVATEEQGKGIGQQLLAYGLTVLRKAGIDIVMTYGDPAYYAKIGFQPVNEADMPAPFKLQHPEGWLGQSLTAQPLSSLKGTSRCVAALNDPVFW